MALTSFEFFGVQATSIVLRSSSNFDGTTVQTADPVVSGGQYVFPAQAGGGVYNFHNQAIKVRNVAYSGGGTATLSIRNAAGLNATVAAFSGTGFYANDIYLAAGDTLNIVSTGATNPIVAFSAEIARNNI